MEIPTPRATPPWWTFGHVWLVIAGPLLVVIASFITLYLAITRPDPVLSQDYYRKEVEINKSSGQSAASLAPAVQMRNHAATGEVPAPPVTAKP
ncbi:MAG: FixH family protein [Rhodoferax sp.]|nr:FixH family protein [Rhodoferax sp.]